MIALLLTTLVLFIGGAALAARLSGPSLVERLLALQIATVSELVICLLVAGTAHFLRPLPVAIEYVGVSALLVFASGGRRTGEWVRRLGGDLGRTAWAGRRALRSPWVALLAVVSLGELAWRCALAFLLPPTGQDALNYHLVTVAWWLQRGAFVANPFRVTSEGDPANTELVFAHVALFSHNVQVVDLTQIAFALSGALATAGMARLLGARRAMAAVAGVLFFLTPIVLAQSMAAYVDVATASAFAACLYFITRYLRRLSPPVARNPARSRRLLLLAGLAGGLCLGSKSQTPIWIASIAIVLAVNLALVVRRGWLTPWRALSALGTFVLVTVALGGYWYIRDSVVHGNPVYPDLVSVAGRTVFKGYPMLQASPSTFPISIVKSWAHDLVPFAHSEAFYRYDQRAGGLGPVWVYVMLPILVFAAIGLVRHRDRILLCVLAMVTLAWLASPYPWWSRFTIELVVVGAAVTAVCLSRLSTRTATALAWIMTALVLLGVAMTSWQYQLGDGRAIDTPQVVRLAGATPETRTVNLGGYNVANRVPTGDLVALDPENVSLPFIAWGMHFQHRVVAVDLAPRGLGPRLRASGAQYVFVATRDTYGRTVHLPRPLVQLVASQGGLSLYRVRSR